MVATYVGCEIAGFTGAAVGAAAAPSVVLAVSPLGLAPHANVHAAGTS